MPKNDAKDAYLHFKRDDIALYADIFEPEIQLWLQSGALEPLPPAQIYLAACASEARNVVKQLLIPKYRAIFVVGNDATFERFVNVYRELSPNPTKSVYLGFIPVGRSTFAHHFGLTISAYRLEKLYTMAFSPVSICIPEISSRLALKINVGHQLSSWAYLPHAFRKQLMHTPLSQALPGMCSVSCINESPQACVITRDGMITRTLSKDQVIFTKRVLTLTITPSIRELPSSQESHVRFYELAIQSLAPVHPFLPALKPSSETFLCQRVRLDFPQQAELVTCTSTTSCQSATITLSNRAFNCLAPR